MPFGMVRIDPRLYKKLSKVADKHDLYLRDLVNYILEANAPDFERFGEEIEKEIEIEEEEGEEEGGGGESD